jgi:hypothetical protein
MRVGSATSWGSGRIRGQATAGNRVRVLRGTTTGETTDELGLAVLWSRRERGPLLRRPAGKALIGGLAGL